MNANHRLLLCEDDPNLGNLLTDFLNAKGFVTTLARDGADGIKAFKRDSFEFVILDVMMPLKDGFAVAKEIRAVDKKIPILFLTAKSLEDDWLKGFEAGADDYMTKPFSMDVLLAKIHSIIKRSAPFPVAKDEEAAMTIGAFSYDYHRQVLVHPAAGEIKLTTKENELLFLLGKSKNGILERNFALKSIWGSDSYFNGRSMDVYIAKLRKLMVADPKVKIINVHGKGFKLLED